MTDVSVDSCAGELNLVIDSGSMYQLSLAPQNPVTGLRLSHAISQLDEESFGFVAHVLPKVNQTKW